jgi:hypothetical protein
MKFNSGISKYVIYSDAIKRLENNEDFKSLEDSLVKTLDYLESRYTVKMDYDMITNPVVDRKNELLFKIRNDTEEIMWVYLIFAPRVNYLSIEIDKDRVANIESQFSCFERIVVRHSKRSPSLKLQYHRYEHIERVLEAICNCLDGGGKAQPNDINTPMRPKNRMRKADGSIQLTCGRCSTVFIRADRCPECGQLVKE